MDRTTKFLLAAIAVGLWMIALGPFLRQTSVKASGNMDCKGAIKVNAFGANSPLTGGYNVEWTCTE